MTNLLTTPRQPWLTRGRLLVGVPLGFAVVVSAAVVVLGVRPLLQTLQGLEQRRDTLLSLQRSAPDLERQLNQAETELQMAEEKQALLVGLLAGRDKGSDLSGVVESAGCGFGCADAALRTAQAPSTNPKSIPAEQQPLKSEAES